MSKIVLRVGRPLSLLLLAIAWASAEPMPVPMDKLFQVGPHVTWEITAYPLPGPDDLTKPNWATLFAKTLAESTPPPTKPGQAPLLLVYSKTVTRDGDTIREISHWSDGTSSESWLWRGYLITQSKIPPGISVLGLARGSAFTTNPFWDLFWVGPVFYQGLTKVRTADALYFKQPPPSKGPAHSFEEARARDGAYAWIDATSGMPLACIYDSTLWLYQAPEDTTEMLTPPQAFQAAVLLRLKADFMSEGRYLPKGP